MTRARVRIINGSQITTNKVIDWQGDRELTLVDPFGTGGKFLVEHEPRKDGYVNIFELKNDERKKLADVSPEERVEFHDGKLDHVLRITHHGEPRSIRKRER